MTIASAHFPKLVLHRGGHFHELRKVMGTSKHIDSSAAFLFEVPRSNSPHVAQELQIGGTSAAELKFPQRLLRSSLGNFNSPSGAGIMHMAGASAFRSSHGWVRR